MLSAPRDRRRVLLAGGAGIAALAAGVWTSTRPGNSAAPRPALSASTSPSPASSPSVSPSTSRSRAPAPPRQPDRSGLVSVDTPGWYSWAMMDRSTGRISGSTNMAETNMSASMIKCWIAADYLRGATASGITPDQTRLDEISSMIRDSDNAIARTLWAELGNNASAERLISRCGLTDSLIGDGWSTFQFSARDTCRLANAIATGKAAGPVWTGWLQREMRSVRGMGDFGIRKALPSDQQDQIAIKNGWVTRDTDVWNVNCLAIGEEWTMAVLTRYGTDLDYTHGAQIAQTVASQLLL